MRNFAVGLLVLASLGIGAGSIIYAQQVNQPPTVRAFPCPKALSLDPSVLGGALVNLGSTATTIGSGSLTYQWTLTFGPRPVEFLDSTDLDALACFTFPGDYVFLLEVTDAQGVTGSDVKVVTISAP